MAHNELVTKQMLQDTEKRLDTKIEKTEQRLYDKIDHSIGMVLEKMDENNRMIMEILIPMKETVDRIPYIEAELARTQRDTGIIEIALKATNTQVAGHEQRITTLETA